jgi:bis(5'-nucleosyl)-tetraphosphatase (symmetrical)
MHYLIGDLQGCATAFERLLAEIGFSPSRDHVHVLGDIVNRGPGSLPALRRLRGLQGSATCLLGNHDLHLLAVAHGIRKQSRSDTLADVLAAPDRDELLHWLRHQRMADRACGWLLVHAGVVPQWDAVQTLALAGEVEALLRADDWLDFLRVMYGNEPKRWHDDLAGADRARFIVNVLTRIRFCNDGGTLEFAAKDSATAAPPGYRAWFDVPDRRSAGEAIAFGHWSTLGLINRPDLLALDTGCVWGGALTAARIDSGRREIVQVACEQAQAPKGT